MVDIASQKDTRGVRLDEVGVTGVKIPIRVKDLSDKRDFQYTIGSFNAFVALPEDVKGTHMSRLVEVIYDHRENINHDGLIDMAGDLVTKLEALESKVEVSFPYFVDQYSPVSKLHNLMTYNARFSAETGLTNMIFKMGVDVDVMTVCPCALEECGTGASHVQRGLVKIDVEPEKDEWVWLEDLIDIANCAASSPVYERLKRPDEKYVVLRGFEFPRFVEDVVRECVVQIEMRDDIFGYNISCENFESIHQHNAYARRYDNWNRT